MQLRAISLLGLAASLSAAPADAGIHHVRDPIEKCELVKAKGEEPRYETVITDHGVEDKGTICDQSTERALNTRIRLCRVGPSLLSTF